MDWASGLSDEWQDLFRNSSTATPFQSPEWLTTWSEVFASRRKPWVITVREGNDLVGLFPLIEGRGVWRVLRPMGIRGSDYLHPLVRTGFETSASEAISASLAESKGIDVVDLHQIRETLPLDVERAAVTEQANCLVLTLPATYDAYLSTLGKSLRFDCRRLGKAPFSTGEATVHQVSESEARDALALFFDLHKQRWRTRGLPGAFALPSIRRFHEAVVPKLARAGHLRMHVMKSQGEPVGVLYAMHAGETTFFYQCGFNPEHKSLSPGTLLVASAIRDAITEGDKTFDFLRGDEPYKRRWKPQEEFRNLRHLLALNPVRGQLGKTVNDASGRFEAKIRARLEGKGLLG